MLRLDAGVLDHLGPFGRFALNEVGELLRRIADQDRALARQLRRTLADPSSPARQPRSISRQRRRASSPARSCRTSSPPAARAYPLPPWSAHRAHSQSAPARRSRWRAICRPSPAEAAREDRESHLHLLAEQVVHGGRRAAIGHVHDIDLGGELEQFARELRQAAWSRRGKVDLTRLSFA